MEQAEPCGAALSPYSRGDIIEKKVVRSHAGQQCRLQSHRNLKKTIHSHQTPAEMARPLDPMFNHCLRKDLVTWSEYVRLAQREKFSEPDGFIHMLLSKCSDFSKPHCSYKVGLPTLKLTFFF